MQVSTETIVRVPGAAVRMTGITVYALADDETLYASNHSPERLAVVKDGEVVRLIDRHTGEVLDASLRYWAEGLQKGNLTQVL
jgi:antibiotic biosynthesis monooxygenase (ABM) superfamily enzyme